MAEIFSRNTHTPICTYIFFLLHRGYNHSHLQKLLTIFLASSVDLIVEWELKASLDQVMHPSTTSPQDISPRLIVPAHFQVPLLAPCHSNRRNQKLSFKPLLYFVFHTSRPFRLLEN